MLDVLYKKACGYTVEEKVLEYGFDEEGNPKLIKEKVHSKYIPPDITAIKAYMESMDKSLYQMSEEDLQKEKARLLKQLSKKSIKLGVKNEEKERRGISKGNQSRF